jgi:cysteine desulfurase family protein (TIGR01976 family)
VTAVGGAELYREDVRLDIDRVRADYPALREGFAHFDGAAGTLVAARSAAAIAQVTGSAVANKSSAFAPGRRALEIVAQARAAVADLLGADPDGVVFGPSATALTYLVSRTLAADWGPGDEIVVSRLDHDANIRPWVQAADRVGATVRWAEFEPDTGELPAGQYRELVNERTRVVAVTGASNAIGSCPDVTAIADIARSVGAVTYVDGVHRTPHLPVDVASLGADFYVTSAYKWSGPHIAACVASPDRWERLRPEKLVPSPDAVPDRFEYGTQSFELLAGVTGAVDHLADLAGDSTEDRRSRVLHSMTVVESYERELFAALVAGLREIDGVSLCPAPAGGCPTVAFRVGDQHPGRTAEILGEQGICVFAGDYYAYEYFNAIGLRVTGGAVRASIYHYTTIDEVARLLEAVKRCR